jgi:hypothetical protein
MLWILGILGLIFGFLGLEMLGDHMSGIIPKIPKADSKPPASK